MKSIKEAKVGENLVIAKIEGDGPTKRRIMDMGITKGCEIYIRKVAPLGDPVQISLRGYELTIRREDARNILVHRP